MIFSFDPGQKNNGFCMFSYDPENRTADLRVMTVLPKEGLFDMLTTVHGICTASPGVKHIFVCENFRNDMKVRGKVTQWDELHTVRMVGAIELTAHMVKSEFVTQEPTILAMARKWSPIKLNKGHLRDDHSAFLHGVHFLIKTQRIDNAYKVTMFGQKAVE